MLYKYNIPRKQQHFNLTNGKLVYCFHGELIFFRQNKPKDSVSKPFILPRYTKKFRARRDFQYPQTLFTYCILISNPLNT